jgi:hypothetical protein
MVTAASAETSETLQQSTQCMKANTIHTFRIYSIRELSVEINGKLNTLIQESCVIIACMVEEEAFPYCKLKAARSFVIYYTTHVLVTCLTP